MGDDHEVRELYLLDPSLNVRPGLKNLLEKRGIVPAIDLIVGLPGDDLQGFSRSAGFVVENELQDDVQVFPLSVLPGTDFRLRSNELGLRFEKSPL